MNILKLKGKMAEAGYTQRKLAAAIGMSKDTLNSRFTGKTEFSTDEAFKICDELRIEDLSERAAIFLAN